MPKLIDSHAHLTDAKMLSNFAQIMQRAKENGISSIINVCCTHEALLEGIEKQKTYPNLFLAAAASPHDVDKFGDAFFLEVEKLAREKKLVAIGETGLDYYYHISSAKNQQKHLLKYIDLANKINLPLIFHVREAFNDFFQLLPPQTKGVLHCFTGTLEEAQKGLDLGLYISFSGIITFKKSLALQEVVKKVPLEKILIETDSPYLAPQCQRGKINEPSFLKETAQMIAKLKNISFEEIARITSHNTKKIFNLKS